MCSSPVQQVCAPPCHIKCRKRLEGCSLWHLLPVRVCSTRSRLQVQESWFRPGKVALYRKGYQRKMSEIYRDTSPVLAVQSYL